MEENSRLRGDGERVALEGKELRREKKELEKETEKLRTELTVSSKNRVRTPCNIIITKVDDHHMFNCEQKPIVVTESNQQLEQ
jgi:hypothetical protein